MVGAFEQRIRRCIELRSELASREQQHNAKTSLMFRVTVFRFVKIFVLLRVFGTSESTAGEEWGNKKPTAIPVERQRSVLPNVALTLHLRQSELIRLVLCVSCIRNPPQPSAKL